MLFFPATDRCCSILWNRFALQNAALRQQSLEPPECSMQKLNFGLKSKNQCRQCCLVPKKSTKFLSRCQIFMFYLIWGEVCGRGSVLCRNLFLLLAIMKNHLATGGCWKQFGRNCLSPDTPLSIFNELQESENRTTNELILLSFCEVYSQICMLNCKEGPALEAWLQSVISHECYQDHQKFSCISK